MCTRLNENAQDPTIHDPIFVRGDDSWIGRVVYKKFGDLGTFRGTVTDVDDNLSEPGYRVFHVEYEDGDDEWIGPDELINILVVMYSCIKLLMNSEILHFVNCICCMQATAGSKHP